MGLMFNAFKKHFTKDKNFLKTTFAKPKKQASSFIKRKPFTTLFGLLGLLVLLIIVSNLLQKPPKQEEEVKQESKSVEVYTIGAAPKLSVQAQIEKSGVVTITALSPGIVQNIYVEPGSEVSRGTTLLYQSSNYQGGDALALQANLAARQLQNINETFDTQKDLIAKQKDITNKTDENSDELREISRKSLEETNNLIVLNEDILEALDAGIAGNTDPSAVLGLQQMKSQFLSANNQLRSALRNTDYASDDEETPAELATLQKDIAIKQLEIQEKALDLSRDVARLQYQLAQVQAATMAPASPFNAIVQRINVKVGQAVQPGTPLIVLSQKIEEDPIVAIAYVPREIANKVSYMEPSILSVGDFEYEAYPSYVTQDAINGSLYGVYFPIPDMYHKQVTNDGYITAQIPVGMFDTGAAVPFIPIDSVYQTENETYVFVAKDKKAISKKITLGNVIGSYVEVENGLASGDMIILDRSVVGGDKVTIQK